MIHRAALRRLCVVGAVTLVGVAGATSPAGAEPSRSVVAEATAQGSRATYSMPNFLVVSEFFDGGGPVSRSLADSTNRSLSFAALPWPGQNAVSLPGAASVAAGRSVPLAYPFHVSADHPTTPSTELADPSGTYRLRASVDQGQAAAEAALAGGGSGAVATTSVVLDDGGRTRVVAETVDRAIDIGEGVLTIASVRSRSESTLEPGAAGPVTRSALVVEGARIGGQPVTIDAQGIHVNQSGAPVPFGQGITAFNEILRHAGITVEVISTGRPGRADVLVITSRHEIPGNPPGTLVWIFGGATTEILVGSDG